MTRLEVVRAGLTEVRSRIATAAEASGRDPGEVTLVVVTKFFPETDVRLLADLGVTDVGENRHQEAEAKAAACADLGLRWHFIGGLQSNKAASIARYAHVVQSVDRAKVLSGLSRGAAERGETVDCLVQVSLDPPGASGRSGVDPGEAGHLAEAVAGTEALRLRGVMGVAPLGGDPQQAFALLSRVRGEVASSVDGLCWMSAGMSGDLEAAVAAGATHVRVGSAVLGPRPRIK